MGALDARHVLIKFETEEAMIKAMARERCNIKGYPYRLARWDAEFNPKKDSSYKPVWIELPKLPLILFQPKLLKVVAESIGKFLDMDNFTRNLLRPSNMCSNGYLQNATRKYLDLSTFDEGLLATDTLPGSAPLLQSLWSAKSLDSNMLAQEPLTQEED